MRMCVCVRDRERVREKDADRLIEAEGEGGKYIKILGLCLDWYHKRRMTKPSIRVFA